MTRINAVPVEELTDNFILAEYFELPRLYPLIAGAVAKYAHPEYAGLPDTYRTGTGHMRFFYDKLFYLRKRHRQLAEEGWKRGLALKIDPAVDPAWINSWAFLVPPDWNNDWVPDAQAIQINRDRLQIRRRYEGGSYATGSATPL